METETLLGLGNRVAVLVAALVLSRVTTSLTGPAMLGSWPCVAVNRPPLMTSFPVQARLSLTLTYCPDPILVIVPGPLMMLLAVMLKPLESMVPLLAVTLIRRFCGMVKVLPA